MLTLFFTLTIFLLAVAGLALGILFRRSPLKGSCGGCGDCLCRRKKHECYSESR